MSELETLLSCSVGSLIDALNSRAQELENETENDEEEKVDRLPRAETSTKDLDLDELFAGLLER